MAFIMLGRGKWSSYALALHKNSNSDNIWFDKSRVLIFIWRESAKQNSKKYITAKWIDGGNTSKISKNNIE